MTLTERQQVEATLLGMAGQLIDVIELADRAFGKKAGTRAYKARHAVLTLYRQMAEAYERQITMPD